MPLWVWSSWCSSQEAADSCRFGPRLCVSRTGLVTSFGIVYKTLKHQTDDGTGGHSKFLLLLLFCFFISDRKGFLTAPCFFSRWGNVPPRVSTWQIFSSWCVLSSFNKYLKKNKNPFHRYIQVISHAHLLCKQGPRWMLIGILKPYHLHSREWGKKIIPKLYLNFLSKIKTRKCLSWNKRGTRRRDWLCLNPCFSFTLARRRKLLIHRPSGFFILSTEMMIRELLKGHGEHRPITSDVWPVALEASQDAVLERASWMSALLVGIKSE